MTDEERRNEKKPVEMEIPSGKYPKQLIYTNEKASYSYPSGPSSSENKNTSSDCSFKSMDEDFPKLDSNHTTKSLNIQKQEDKIR